MKKMKVIISCICIMIAMVFITGCGSISVDYDLVTCGASVTYTTVTKLKSTPINYKNKTFRISGEMKSGGSSYHYLSGYDATNCCAWNLEVQAAEGVKLPSKTKTVTVIGTFRTTNNNGKSSGYLEVTEIK